MVSMTETPNVLVCADLHLDLWLAEGRDPFAGLDPDKLAALDALIIAGDLSNKPKVRWPRMLAHLGQYVPLSKIHVMPGNHDYYDHVLDGEDRLARICKDAGAHFAQKSWLVIGRTRYLCCTLWTDFDLDGSMERDMYQAGKWMNDYAYIRMQGDRYRKIVPLDIARVHVDHRAWLQACLARNFPGRTIVVTHHAPLADCLPIRHGLPAAYASDMSALIDRYQPDEWIYGHTHDPGAVRHGGTKVRCVSVGYPHEVDTDIPPALAAFGA